MARKIRAWYNAEQADSIWLNAGSQFQGTLSKEGFSNALKTQLFPYGHIVGFGFANTIDHGVDRYRLTTEKGLNLQMLLKLDAEGKISTLYFQPWKGDVRERKDSLWYDNARTNALDNLVHEAAINFLEKSNTPGISILVLQNNRANYYNYGWARESTQQHPTPQMLYEIGSLTKTFTAFLLADAVLNKQVKLADPITKFLPDSVAKNKNLAQITLMQLSNHTSGLPRLPSNMLPEHIDLKDPYRNYSPDDLFSYLRTAKTENKPGTTYSYSNLGFGLLGVILEKIYQKPLEEIYRQLIFQPFGMRNTTSLSLADTTMAAAPHNQEGNPSAYWNFQSMAAAGSIKSNLEDMARYAMQFTLRPRGKNNKPDERILLVDSLTFSDKNIHAGLGWRFNQASTENRRMIHSGGTGGFRSHLEIIPARKEAILVLSNAEDEQAIVLGELLSKQIREMNK